jgi:hypothetical protein
MSNTRTNTNQLLGARVGRQSAGFVAAMLGAMLIAVPTAARQTDPANPVPPGTPTAAQPAAPVATNPWEMRTSLSPADPLAYFTLAEDFADLAGSATSPDESKRALTEARRLFILAAHTSLKRTSSGGAGLAASAFTALAAIAELPDEARWLRGVAQGVAPAARSVRWEPSPRALAADAGAYDLAVALGRYRSGEFRRVRDTLRRQPDAAALLVRSGLDERQARAIISDLESDSAKPSGCPRCKGERVIRGPRTPDDAKPTVELCPVCLGNPAPTPALTPERFANELRAEALLLGAAPTTWSAQSRIDGAAPLRDIDPAAVAAHYSVDPEASVYRNGVWVRP